MAETLLKKGLDFNAKDINGNSPLHQAVLTKELTLVELLVGWKCSINVRNA